MMVMKGLKRCGTPAEGQGVIPDLGADAAMKVLSFLPLRHVYQLRVVSKEWNAVLRSRAFLQLWSSVTELLVMVKNADDGAPFCRELFAYDASSAGWISLLPLLASHPDLLSALGGPSLRSVANRFRMDACQCLSEFMVAGGAGGLACFLCSPFINPPHADGEAVQESHIIEHAYNSEIYSLLVLDVVTGSYNCLPPNPRQKKWHFEDWQRDFCVLQLSLRPLTHAPTFYCVFLQVEIDEGSFPGHLEVYDSRSNAWKIGKSCCGPLDAKIAGMADLDRADLIQYCDHTDTLFAYSVDLDEWSQVCVQPPKIWRLCKIEPWDSYFLKGLTLLRHRGRILLAVVQGACRSYAGFAVWELRLHHSSPPISATPGTPVAEWVEVARTPERYWKGFYDLDFDNLHDKSVKLISGGNLICMTSVHYTDTQYGGTYYPPLVYDLMQDSWYHLPPYKGGYDFVAALGLQPSFMAVP